jgi:hypothetical protein
MYNTQTPSFLANAVRIISSIKPTKQQATMNTPDATNPNIILNSKQCKNITPQTNIKN